jgi:hypothetical protein
MKNDKSVEQSVNLKPEAETGGGGDLKPEAETGGGGETGSARPVKDPIAAYPEAHRKLIMEQVEAKSILVVKSDVTIRAKSSPTKKDEVQPFLSYFAQNARGMSALCNGKIPPQTPKPAEGKDERSEEQKAVGACDYFNYGYDLDLRQPIRVSLEDSLAGPEKAIEKQVKSLVDGGLMTAEEATTWVIAQRKIKGLPVPVGV